MAITWLKYDTKLDIPALQVMRSVWLKEIAIYIVIDAQINTLVYCLFSTVHPSYASILSLLYRYSSLELQKVISPYSL